MIEIPGETGTCYSGRSIDYLVVSKNFRHCVRNVQVDKSAPWLVHVAIAFDVLRKPLKIQSRQLVSPSPLAPVATSQCTKNGLKRYRVAQSALLRNSPQEASHLPGPASGDSLVLSRLFSEWSVASERHLKSECEVEGSARVGWQPRQAGKFT